MKNYVVRFNDGRMWFFNNKRAIDERNFNQAVCYEIPEDICVDDLITLQIGNYQRLELLDNKWKKMWDKSCQK